MYKYTYIGIHIYIYTYTYVYISNMVYRLEGIEGKAMPSEAF